MKDCRTTGKPTGSPLCPQSGTDPEALVRRYQMICELGQLVTSEMNLDALFELIMEQTRKIMNSERASVFLHDAHGDQLYCWASIDLKRNAIRISTDCGVAGWVFRTKTPLILNDPYSDHRFYPGVDLKTGFRTRNILCCPLVNQSQTCIGTIQALNKTDGDFLPQDLELFTSASYYITIALENAKLYEDLKALDRIRERMIHHLSHELKTPLAIISGALRFLDTQVKAGDFTRLDRAIQRGERNVRRLQVLQEKIEDILSCRESAADCRPDLHRIACELLEDVFEERGETDPATMAGLTECLQFLKRRQTAKLNRIPLAAFVQEICNRARAAMGRRQLCIVRQLDEEIALTTDVHVLEKVCTGLLKNAIENTPDEGTVEVVVAHSDGEIRISFTDTGVGITTASQAAIFGGFSPTQDVGRYATKRPYEFDAGGAGADLLRIKHFSEKLGFAIEFESRRCAFLPDDADRCPGVISRCRFVSSKTECLTGSGSTFRVRFPADGTSIFERP
jgi:signal transduction histidine kinase